MQLFYEMFRRNHLPNIACFESDRFSTHRRNTVDRRGYVASCVGRRLAGVLQELEIRTGTRQPAVESRLQGHRDKRHGEQQHVV